MVVDILSILRLLWRQRIVVVVMCVLSIILLAMVFAKTPPKYTAGSSVVLFNPPRAPGDEKPPQPGTEEAKRIDNPYVRFNDTSIVVDVLRRMMLSDTTAERLRGKGVTAPYTIAANLDFYRGPIVDVATEGATAEGAIASNRLVVDELIATLAQMQADQGTDPIYSFTADEVVSPTKAKRVITSTLRRLIGAGAFCGFLVLASAVAADVFSARRKKAAKPGAAMPTGIGGSGGDSPEAAEAVPGRLSLIASQSRGRA